MGRITPKLANYPLPVDRAHLITGYMGGCSELFIKRLLTGSLGSVSLWKNYQEGATMRAIPTTVKFKKTVETTETVSGIYNGYSLATIGYKLNLYKKEYEIVDFRIPVEGDTYIRKDNLLMFLLKTVDNANAFSTPRSPRLIVQLKVKKTRVIFENPVEVKTYLKKGDVYTLPDWKDQVDGVEFKGFYESGEAQRVNKSYGRCIRWDRREEEY